jgi:hypothetical protein
MHKFYSFLDLFFWQLCFAFLHLYTLASSALPSCTCTPWFLSGATAGRLQKLAGKHGKTMTEMKNSFESNETLYLDSNTLDTALGPKIFYVKPDLTVADNKVCLLKEVKRELKRIHIDGCHAKRQRGKETPTKE